MCRRGRVVSEVARGGGFTVAEVKLLQRYLQNAYDQVVRAHRDAIISDRMREMAEERTDIWRRAMAQRFEVDEVDLVLDREIALNLDEGALTALVTVVSAADEEAHAHVDTFEWAAARHEHPHQLARRLPPCDTHDPNAV